MSISKFLICLVGYFQVSIATYALQDDYNPTNFFSMFDFFTGADPTNGFVDYVDQPTAEATGLVWTNDTSIYMGVDHTNITPNGRPSVRLTSTNSYLHGLIILDVANMPGGFCGTWPAFWMVGPNWPNGGEIDIIEGVNDGSTNQCTLHTGPGCEASSSGFTGTLLTSVCDVNDPNQATNAGCGISSTDTSTYGSAFNAAKGGVYATEWTSEAISIWFFPRSSIPADISGGAPDPTGWGAPMASFSGGCDISSSFTNQNIVFDTTFCGDWAGSVWDQSSYCSSQASSCNDYVANNPSVYWDAYWSVNSLQVFQDNGATSTVSLDDSAKTHKNSTKEKHGSGHKHLKSHQRRHWHRHAEAFS